MQAVAGLAQDRVQSTSGSVGPDRHEIGDRAGLRKTNSGKVVDGRQRTDPAQSVDCPAHAKPFPGTRHEATSDHSVSLRRGSDARRRSRPRPRRGRSRRCHAHSCGRASARPAWPRLRLAAGLLELERRPVGSGCPVHTSPPPTFTPYGSPEPGSGMAPAGCGSLAIGGTGGGEAGWSHASDAAGQEEPLKGI
jgi:hypothetical protein